MRFSGRVRRLTTSDAGDGEFLALRHDLEVRAIVGRVTNLFGLQSRISLNVLSGGLLI